jgi:aryl-alcohol dehydrogenase-like predicted oxidoreductase
MAAGASRFLNDRNFDKVEALEKVAAEAGVSLLHLAMGGLAAQPTVASVIAGATSPEQIKANVAAGTWTPPPDVLAAIDEATK